MSATKPSKSVKAKPASSGVKPIKAAKTVKKPAAKKATKVASKDESPMLFKNLEKTPVKTKAKAVKKTATKSVTPQKATRSAAKVLKSVEPKQSAAEIQIVISNESIATRAYYISERRQAMGWPGDSQTDWLEALNQLTAEAKRRKS